MNAAKLACYKSALAILSARNLAWFRFQLDYEAWTGYHKYQWIEATERAAAANPGAVGPETRELIALALKIRMTT